MIYACSVPTNESKSKLARNLPEPAEVTDQERQAVALEARTWRGEVMTKVAAIEAVTETDLKARAR